MAAPTYAPIYTNSSGTVTGLAWGPGAASCRVTAALNSDEIQDEVSLNQVLYGMNNLLAAMAGQEAPATTSTPTIGTTVTVATPASVIYIDGVYAAVAAETAKAFGALGTIPASTWGVIKMERIANATTSFQSGAGNYTTGYATEALAIAAMPATGAGEVATGFLTILASASGWVAGTDALAGGTGGNPATTTNYYGFIGFADATTGPWANAKQTANKAGTVLTSTAG
jgi:hypothetical protein